MIKNSVTRIFLDIETIPDQREGAADKAASLISAPSNYKDQAKIDAYVAERAAEAWTKTALDGGYGEIYCIGYALDNQDAEVIYRDLEDPESTEREVLESFWDMVDEHLVSDPTWIGHNVQRFDLRFLWQRSVINRVPMRRQLPFDVSPWSERVADTMMMWTGDRNKFIAQDELLDILGIESTDPIRGKDVWSKIEAGESDTVIRHCARNVEEVREAWRLMMMLP